MTQEKLVVVGRGDAGEAGGGGHGVVGEGVAPPDTRRNRMDPYVRSRV